MDNNAKLAIFGGLPAIDETPDSIWPCYDAGDIATVTKMITDGDLSFSSREGSIWEFEEKAKKYFNAKYAVSTSSGTAGLHSAFFGIGLRPGDEVLAPTYTYFATVMPIFACNAVPVLVDIDPGTGNLDPSQLAEHLTDRTTAIVVTHLAGFPVDMKPIVEFARNNGLKIVEDCSHAVWCKNTNNSFMPLRNDNNLAFRPIVRDGKLDHWQS